MGNVIDALKERGFIEAMTSEKLRQLAEKPLTIYCGFDPSSNSLHLGNLVAIMGLAWFQHYGHTPIAIIGGATGMIGDPSGKAMERQLLDEATIESNLQGISKDLATLLDFNSSSPSGAKLLNNNDWFKTFSFVNFLRDVGKYFRIGPMLAKESVKARLNSEEGMSFTEFSYQLLQGYDFLYLFEHHRVTVQLGGSDQWGNITAGIDLIRKVKGQEAFGITFPLLTKSDGQKFGKSEKGAIWLSPERLSPYEFYQYLYRVADADVIKLMRMLTFMEMEEIRHYERELERNGMANAAQKRLAEEITRLVHGEEGLQKALQATARAAPGGETRLDVQALQQIAKDIPNHEVEKQALIGVKLVDVIAEIGLQESKGEAKRLIRNGGVYLNNEKVVDENRLVTAADLMEERFLLLAIGKKNKVIVRVK